MDKTSFQMKVNKFGDGTSLTFSCTAALYPNQAALPEELATCQTNSRQRRQSLNDLKQAQVTASIPIRQSKITNLQPPNMSGAASAILPSIILIFIFA